MDAPQAGPGIEPGLMLDAEQLAARKADNARRVHTLQIPVIRAIGFVIVCLMVALQAARDGTPLAPLQLGLMAVNLAYAGVGWMAMRLSWQRSGWFDVGMLLFHVDVLVWLCNLHYLEKIQPVLRLPAADARGRPGGLRLSACVLLQPRHRGRLPGLCAVAVGLRARRRAVVRAPGHRRHHVRAGRLPVGHRPGDRAPARPHERGGAGRPWHGRQPGAGEPRQVAVPGRREPRDPHADEWHPGHHRAAARHRPAARPAALRQDRPPFRDGLARADRRRARPVAHRGPQAHAQPHAGRPASARHRDRRPDELRRPRQAHHARLFAAGAAAALPRVRPGAPAAAAGEPAAQRGQVHPARQRPRW